MQTKAYTLSGGAVAGSTTSGMLYGVQVTVQGSTAGAAVTIYDNASAASGTILFTANGSGVAATTAVEGLGWHWAGPPNVGIPYSNGLWIVPTASTGGSGVVCFSDGATSDGRPIR